MKREVVKHLLANHKLSQTRACNIAGISRRTYRYISIRDDSEIINALLDMSDKHPGYGFWKIYHRLRSEGLLCNHKRMYRVYCELKLNINRKQKKRLPSRMKQPIIIPQTIDQSWSMDFMHDTLYDGRRFRLLNIIDDHNREVVHIEAGSSIGGHRVVRVLEDLKCRGRKPAQIRVDNGPEFISKIFQFWCQKHKVKIQYIQPGKPTQNAIIERLNKSCRTELLNTYIFESIADVEQKISEWQYEYNYNRPHDSLGHLSPMAYKQNNNN